MQRKRDLVRAVHNRKKPQRHLLEKNGTCKFFKISQEFPEKYSWEILGNFLGKNSWEILRNFSKLSLKTMIPKKSLKLGANSGEFLENFRGIVHKNLFSRNSSEILQSKSPKLENLGKFYTFVTWAFHSFEI